jgi:DNA primase
MSLCGYPGFSLKEAREKAAAARALAKAGRDVIVLADGDGAGEAAALESALRWKKEGRRVRIARPPRGSDFNDVLLGRSPGVGESM